MTITDLALPSDANLPAEQHQPQPSNTVTQTAPVTSKFLVWAEEARQAAKIAVSLAQTSFVPASLRGKAADITAAILAGQELGMQPMTALRSMDVIQGTPALRAHAMRALAQREGHKIWLHEQTDDRVVMRGQRREADGTYGPVQESVWTTARAALLGLTGKEQWKKQRMTMLTARATGEIVRLVASDALYAMPYAVEELEGNDPIEVVPSVPRVTADEILGVPDAGKSPAAIEATQVPADTDGDWPTVQQPPAGGDA